MKLNLVCAVVVAQLSLAGEFVMAGTIPDTYSAGDTLTAEMLDTIKAAVNDNDTSKQDRVSSSCNAGSSIRIINSDGTVVCETDDNTVTISGALGTTASSSTNITSTTHTEIASVSITESGTVNVVLNAHVTAEIAGTNVNRMQLEIRNTSCTGTVLGQAMWRPAGAASDSSFLANTISLTGFQANVVAPETFVLCARKYDAAFPDALIYYRGLVLTYSN